MKEYFYTDGTDKFGPFTLEELKEKKISRETLVWFKELENWTAAGIVPELNEIFILVPPPIVKTNFNETNFKNIHNQKPPKTWLLESILVTLFCCLPLGIVGIIDAAKVESRFYAGDIAEANRLSANAKKWTSVSFWIGLTIGVIYIAVMILVGIGGY